MVDQSVLLSQLVLKCAAAALVIVLARIAVACVLTLVARIARGHPCAGRIARAARVASPRFMRTVLVAAAGTSLVIGATTTGASAAPPQRQGADRIGVLDRLVEQVAEQVTAGSTPSWRDVSPPTEPDLYVVQPGDSLWSISAESLGASATSAQIARSWPRWFAANKYAIGADPGYLVPGQQLRRPAPP